VGFFGKRRNEDELNAEAFARVLSGGDIFEGSPFYEEMTREEGIEAEILFGRAGMAVASYVLFRSEQAPTVEMQAAMMLFGDKAAKAEFHLRCQKAFNPDTVETWLANEQEKNWAALQTKYPSVTSSYRKETLIADARSLIDQNWQNVMVMASAYAASHIDVEGREDEFLDQFYVEPED